MYFFVFQQKEFAKGKKRVANELCDKEKLSDSLLCIAESYQKLRNFRKARKWYNKSWNMYRSIGNLEVSLHVVTCICTPVIDASSSRLCSHGMCNFRVKH
jgi:hypothetical protein